MILGIQIDDGPKTHTFSFTNKWDKPVVIQRVISSCGCAAPEWTRHPVASGAKGEVIVTFNNDIGPYPFDKVCLYILPAYNVRTYSVFAV